LSTLNAYQRFNTDKIVEFAMSRPEDKTLEVVADMLEAYARMLMVIAEIEEVTGKRFEEFLKELFKPEKLSELYKRVPADVYGEFMAALMRLVSIASTIQNPLALSINEKKRVSKEIMEIAEAIRKMTEKLKVGRNE
jgi:hypothetical protein